MGGNLWSEVASVGISHPTNVKHSTLEKNTFFNTKSAVNPFLWKLYQSLFPEWKYCVLVVHLHPFTQSDNEHLELLHIYFIFQLEHLLAFSLWSLQLLP